MTPRVIEEPVKPKRAGTLEEFPCERQGQGPRWKHWRTVDRLEIMAARRGLKIIPEAEARRMAAYARAQGLLPKPAEGFYYQA